MRTIRMVPAVLAALLLGAHFFRAGNGAMVVLAGILAIAALVEERRVRLGVRVALAAGAIDWVWTAWSIARERAALGQGYVRMLAILGAVAAFTALAAWLLPPGRKAAEIVPSPD